VDGGMMKRNMTLATASSAWYMPLKKKSGEEGNGWAWC